LNYKEYLKSEEWQRTRRWALDRAGNKCQLCKSDKKLNVHHNNYLSLGKEEPSDVIVLCERCHRIHHDNEKPKENIRRKKPKFIFEFNPIINPEAKKLIERLNQHPNDSETKHILAEIDRLNKIRVARKKITRNI
jgi:hypothetical protein